MNLLDSNEFADFILTEYFKDSKLSDKDKLAEVHSSKYKYQLALECFKLSTNDLQYHNQLPD